ncbi:MAG: MreB/Mrl family cell shape determining protein [Candidatus Nealsonbacteria bacterium]|nr:MreB/Mrl family cell shape determining protein [Candidatus Nealsonbacteria bacterium]
MRLGIDLGTCNSVVYVPKKGVTLQEPSVVAVDLSDNTVLAVGQEAKEMMGRTPDMIRVYRPLRDGVIANYRVTHAMMKHFLDKTMGWFRFLKPEIMVGVPAGITSTERRAVIEAGLSVGAKEVYLSKEPILAGIGAGVPINSCSGNMVLDIGGGTAEAAVISLGGIVNFRSIRVAGDKMNSAIADYIKEKYNLAIGTQTADEIKKRIGTALPLEDEKEMEIRGRDLALGLPKNIKITSNDVCEALSDVLSEIVQMTKLVLRDTPPELSADIMNKGMVMTGGGSLLDNLPELIAKSTGVPAILAEDSLLCVAKGTGAMLENLDLYKRAVMSKKR